MAYPATYAEKKQASYVSTANAVASESPTTPNHAQRLAIAKQMAQLNSWPPFEIYVDSDFKTQGYDDTTPLATMQNRMSALLTNLVALGFGG